MPSVWPLQLPWPGEPSLNTPVLNKRAAGCLTPWKALLGLYPWDTVLLLEGTWQLGLLVLDKRQEEGIGFELLSSLFAGAGDLSSLSSKILPLDFLPANSVSRQHHLLVWEFEGGGDRDSGALPLCSEGTRAQEGWLYFLECPIESGLGLSQSCCWESLAWQEWDVRIATMTRELTGLLCSLLGCP